MESLIQSDIFFFISSIGFIILGILVAVALFYAITTFRSLRRITKKLEAVVDDAGETAEEWLEGIRDTAIYRLFVKSSRSKASSASRKK